MFPHCVRRSQTPGLGATSLLESSADSGARHSRTVLVCGDVCCVGMLIQPTSGWLSEGKSQGCLLMGEGGHIDANNSEERRRGIKGGLFRAHLLPPLAGTHRKTRLRG